MTRYQCYDCGNRFDHEGGQIAAKCPNCNAGYPMLEVLG